MVEPLGELGLFRDGQLDGVFSALAVLALLVWLTTHVRHLWQQDEEPVQEWRARRALWWTVAFLTAGALVEAPPLRMLLDAVGPGWNKALMHLFGATAAGALLHLLRLLQGGRPGQVRQINAAIVVSAVLTIAPLLIDPPRTAHLFEATPAAVVHWVASLALLTVGLASTAAACLRNVDPESKQSARIGLRVIAIGNTIGLLYVAACLTMLIAVLATGTSPPTLNGRGIDVTLQQIAELVIVTGLVWRSIAEGGIRALRWVQQTQLGQRWSTAGVVVRLTGYRERRRVERQLAIIRPWWVALADALPEKVHFPAETGAATTSADLAAFQRSRMLTEIHDIERLALAYVDEGDRQGIRDLAARHRLRGPAVEMAIWQTCVLIGARRHIAGLDRCDSPLPEPPAAGTTVPQAAAALSRRLRGVHRHRERILRLLT